MKLTFNAGDKLDDAIDCLAMSEMLRAFGVPHERRENAITMDAVDQPRVEALLARLRLVLSCASK